MATTQEEASASNTRGIPKANFIVSVNDFHLVFEDESSASNNNNIASRKTWMNLWHIKRVQMLLCGTCKTCTGDCFVDTYYYYKNHK